MDPVPDDVLFVACTRPPVVAIPFINVPYAAFYANMLGSFMLGIWFGPAWWLACIPLHLWMRHKCSEDHNFVRITALWVQTRFGDLGERFGVTSFLPKPLQPYKSASEVNGG